jgi:hypothetical protein
MTKNIASSKDNVTAKTLYSTLNHVDENLVLFLIELLLHSAFIKKLEYSIVSSITYSKDIITK